jgi:hypothetical protein
MRISLLCITAILACYMGFYNGFPFVYPDTGSYIFSGFKNEVLIDRPIMYGLFLRHVSLAESLWLVVFVQSLLLTFSVYYIFRYFSKVQNFTLYFLGFFAVILLFTGVSVNICQLIPDVFTPILILTFIVLMLGEQVSRTHYIICAILFLMALTMHTSHMAIIGLFLFCVSILFFIRKWRKRPETISLRKLGLGWTLLLSGWMILCTTHYALGGKFAAANASHVFMVNRLVDMGIMKDFLDESCRKKEYKFCEFKDDVPVDFLWDEKESPLYKTGGWEQNRAEYNEIISEVFSRPKYIKSFIMRSFESGLQQFFSFDTGDTPSLKEGSAVYGTIDWFYHSLLRDYVISKQFRGHLNYDLLNFVQRIVIIIAMILSCLILYSSELSPGTRKLMLFVLGLLLCNAVVCGSLASVNMRFQSRVVWLILLPVFICLTERGSVKRILDSYRNQKR